MSKEDARLKGAAKRLGMPLEKMVRDILDFDPGSKKAEQYRMVATIRLIQAIQRASLTSTIVGAAQAFFAAALVFATIALCWYTARL